MLGDKGYAKVEQVVQATGKSGKDYTYLIISSGGDYGVAYPVKDSNPVAGRLCQYWSDKRDPKRPCRRARGL